MLILEVVRPGGHRLAKALVAEILASSVSFGHLLAIAGAVFLDAYRCRSTRSRTGNCWRGSPWPVAALVVTLLAGFVMVRRGCSGWLKLPGIASTTLGGVVFGIVGVALPLTLFSGSAQLKTVLNDAGTLRPGLLVAR